MRLINRGSKQSPVARQACAAALNAHYAKFGDYGRVGNITDYTLQVGGSKVRVEVANRKESYVATAMTGMRRLNTVATGSWRGK